MSTWLPKELERIAQFQYLFVLCLPLPPYNVDLFRDMGSITCTGLRFVLPNVLSSKSNIFPVGGLSFSFTG